MKVTNIYQAKTQLSALVDRALAGDEVVIARWGKPLVRLVAYYQDMNERVPGKFKGKVTISDNFDDESSEIIDLFSTSHEQ